MAPSGSSAKTPTITGTTPRRADCQWGLCSGSLHAPLYQFLPITITDAANTLTKDGKDIASVSLTEWGTTIMLTPTELAELDRRIGEHTDLLIAASDQRNRSATRKATKKVASKTSNRGRPSKVIVSPFEGFIGPSTEYGQYPYFASDIIEGIARLDWHDRPIGQGGSSKPLSVKRLFRILAQLSKVTTESVGDFLHVNTRQAQRYVKAIELAMPYLMKSRPQCLVFEMDYGEIPAMRPSDWTDELETPSAEVLAKLHGDMRDLGERA